MTKKAQYNKEWFKHNPEKKAQYAAAYYQRNKEASKERSRIYRLENKDKIKEYRLKNSERNKKYCINHALTRRYGITLKQYNDLLSKQNHTCGICGTNSSDFSRRLAVDHCHTTDRVRGLLCSNCNTLLGLSKENPTVLLNAIAYINTTGEPIE